jgi:hypothetical protein
MSLSFEVDAREEDEGFRIAVKASDESEKVYFVPTGTQQDFSAFYRELAHDFGTRMPHVFAEKLDHPAPHMRWRPLLTDNVHPDILAGYGDPAVFKDDEDYWLVATSNDAPDAFPILHSSSRTGETERRDSRISSIFASFGSPLICFSVTGASGLTGSTCTDTQFESLGSGAASRVTRMIPTTCRSSPLW